ncbi:MAG: apolipoprotein N-acyltransferase [Flammeovirgaceae bacterium]
MLEKIQQFRGKRFYLLTLSVLSGALLSLSWYFPFTLLAFIALVPLLELENQIYEGDYKWPKLTFWLYALVSMTLWNIGVIWWLWNASGFATLGAWGANAVLQTFPLILFQLTKRASNDKFGFIPFVVFWVAFEYVHLNWDLSWVWLNLGNVFANVPAWVQWYEYIGSFGGTIWILIANVLAYRALLLGRSKLNVALCIIFPMVVSYILYFSYEETGKDIEAVVVQPNLDCYTEKFSYNAKTGQRNQTSHVPYKEQLNRLISLSEEKMTDKTQFVLWPETAMHQTLNAAIPFQYNDFRKADSLIKRHPNARLISGISTIEQYKDPSEHTITTRHHKSLGYYDVFGSAAFFTGTPSFEIYHKSKLVIGVETIPFPSVLRSLIMDFGGSSGGLGSQKEREVFFNQEEGAAPVICYESVYGDFMTEYVQKGATFIAIVTNDGWWGNTSGHRQHMNYARLRAIELRRAVARSANTGVSGFINQRGDIIQESKYDEMIALNGTIKSNNELTLYAQIGDIIGRLAAFLAPFLVLSAFVRKKVRG